MYCAECCRRYRTRRIPGERRRISRESRRFSRRKRLADPQHDVFSVIPAEAFAPLRHLLGEVSGGLAREGRVGAAPFAPRTVTGGARGKAARFIALLIERGRFA
ncbi:hypothetical protein TomMM35A_04060 [Sphingobium sp. TomMM35A]